jgi:hypothetical protein
MIRPASRSEVGKSALPFPEPLWQNYGVTEAGDVVNLLTGLPLRPALRGKSGYLAVSLWNYGSAKTWFVHQMVAITFHGPRPSSSHQASHADGNKLNNHRDNIRWITRAENERDKIAHGKSNRGDRNGMSRAARAARGEI